MNNNILDGFHVPAPSCLRRANRPSSAAGRSGVIHQWPAARLREVAAEVSHAGAEVQIFSANPEVRQQAQDDLQIGADRTCCAAERLAQSLSCTVFKIPGTRCTCLLGASAAGLSAVGHPISLRPEWQVGSEELQEAAIPLLQQAMVQICKEALGLAADASVNSNDQQQLQTLLAELTEEWDPTDPSKSMLSEEPFLTLLASSTRRLVLLFDAAAATAAADGYGPALFKAYVPESLQLTVEQLSTQLCVLPACSAVCLVFSADHFDVVLLQHGAVLAANVESATYYDESDYINHFCGSLCSSSFGTQMIGAAGIGRIRLGTERGNDHSDAAAAPGVVDGQDAAHGVTASGRTYADVATASAAVVPRGATCAGPSSNQVLDTALAASQGTGTTGTRPAKPAGAGRPLPGAVVGPLVQAGPPARPVVAVPARNRTAGPQVYAKEAEYAAATRLPLQLVPSDATLKVRQQATAGRLEGDDIAGGRQESSGPATMDMQTQGYVADNKELKRGARDNHGRTRHGNGRFGKKPKPISTAQGGSAGRPVTDPSSLGMSKRRLEAVDKLAHAIHAGNQHLPRLPEDLRKKQRKVSKSSISSSDDEGSRADLVPAVLIPDSQDEPIDAAAAAGKYYAGAGGTAGSGDADGTDDAVNRQGASNVDSIVIPDSEEADEQLGGIFSEMACLMAANGTGAKGGKLGGSGVTGTKAKHVSLGTTTKHAPSPGGPMAAAAASMVAATADAAGRQAAVRTDASGLLANVGTSGEGSGALSGHRSVPSKLKGADYFAHSDKVSLAQRFADLASIPGRSCTKAGQQLIDASVELWHGFLQHCPLAQAGSGDTSGYSFKGTIVVEHWPPSPRLWMLFHAYVRENVDSHNRYVCVINDVARLESSKFCVAIAQKQIVMLANQADPTVLYCQADRKMRLLLAREYGKEVHKTLFINMEEARNGHRFIDQNSALGLQDAALWNLSCVSGGRRARTYSAIRLRHLSKLQVEEITDAVGSNVLIVSFRVEFVDEKYMDDRGARHCCESFAGWSDVWEHAFLSASYLAYPLLVYRDVFEGGNPLLTAKAGDALSIKRECLDWFLFCRWEGDVPLDCVPLSPGAVSDSTRKLLRRMGRPERGHRAHRSGAVSRALILNLLKNKGMQIDIGLENVVVRWGGWSTKHGVATMKEVYESLLLDDFINVSGLAFGIGDEMDVWEHRTKTFIGKVLTPTKPIYDQNSGAGKGGSVFRLPWSCRMRARQMLLITTVW